MVNNSTSKKLKSLRSAFLPIWFFFMSFISFSQTAASIQYRCGSSNLLNKDQFFRIDFPNIPSPNPLRFKVRLVQLNSLPFNQNSTGGRYYNHEVRDLYPTAKVNFNLSPNNNLTDTLKIEISHLDKAFPTQIISMVIRYNTIGNGCNDNWGDALPIHFAKNDVNVCIENKTAKIAQTIDVLKNDRLLSNDAYPYNLKLSKSYSSLVSSFSYSDIVATKNTAGQSLIDYFDNPNLNSRAGTSITIPYIIDYTSALIKDDTANLSIYYSDNCETSNEQKVVNFGSLKNLDNDGDLVNNYIDLDDDNDGILDAIEGLKNCPVLVELNPISILEGNKIKNDTLLISKSLLYGAAPIGLSDGVLVDLKVIESIPENAFGILVDHNLEVSVKNTLPITSPQETIKYQYTFNAPVNLSLGWFGDLFNKNETFTIKVQTGGSLNFRANSSTILFQTIGTSLLEGKLYTNSDISSSNAELFSLDLINVSEITITKQDLTGSATNIGGLKVLKAELCYNDTDRDQIPNHLDLDSDNDLIPDNIEAQSTTNYKIPNAISPNYISNLGVNAVYVGGLQPVDFDLDGTPDYLDKDTDQDGVLDIYESKLFFESSDFVIDKITNRLGNNGLYYSVDNGDTYLYPHGNISDLKTQLADFDLDNALDFRDSFTNSTFGIKNDSFCLTTSAPIALNITQNDFLTLGQTYSTKILEAPIYGTLTKSIDNLNYTYTFNKTNEISVGRDSFKYSIREERTGEVKEAMVFINLNTFELPSLLDNGCGIDFQVTQKMLNSGKWSYDANEISITNEQKTNSKMNLKSNQTIISWLDTEFRCSKPIPVLISKIAPPVLLWKNDIKDQGICTENKELDLFSFIAGADKGQWFLDGNLVEQKLQTLAVKNGKHLLKFVYENGNCITSLEESIVFNKPNTDWEFTNTICLPSETIDLNKLIAEDLLSKTYWSIDNLSFDGKLDPNSLKAASYRINLIREFASCKISNEKIITLVQKPNVEIIGLKKNYCRNEEAVNLANLGTGIWKINKKINSTLSFEVLEDKTIQRIVNDGICADSSSVTVKVLENKNSFINGLLDTYCAKNQEINLNELGVGLWKVNGVESRVLPLVKNGLYEIEYKAESNNECLNSSKNIFILEDPKNTNAGLDITLSALEEDFSLNASAVPFGYEAEWIYDKSSIGLDDRTSVSSSGILYGQDSSALVWKISNSVCPEYVDTLIIRKEKINISGGISPNGDGMNDAFEILGLSNKQIQLTIINRLGQTIVDLDNYKNDWYGTFPNGCPLPEDVYYYTIKIIGEKTRKGTFVIQK